MWPPMWPLALGVAVVVVIVVAVLLELIVRQARVIRRDVADIWTGGKLIAQNTATIALLRDTNEQAQALLASAGHIAESSRRIRAATGRKS